MKTIRLPFLLILVLAAAGKITAAPVVAPDHSLTVKEYVDKGVPSPDKVWSPQDYEAAAKALTDISKSDPTLLPRFNSPQSGALFNHIIDDANLAFITDKSVPVEDRLRKVAAVSSFVPMLMVYANSSKETQTLDTELVEIGAFILRLELDASVTMNEFIKAHPELAGNKQVTDGFNMARGGFFETFGGYVDIMLDHQNLRPSESLRTAAHLKKIFPAFYPLLSPDNQAIILAHLKSAADKEADPALQAAIKEILAGIPAPAAPEK